jgi:hypothetical protein
MTDLAKALWSSTSSWTERAWLSDWAAATPSSRDFLA